MDPALWAALGGAGVVVLVLLGVALAALAQGRRARAAEQAARADVEGLRDRLEEVAAELAASRGAAGAVPPATEFVITTAGEPQPAGRVPERAAMSVTVSEPLVKAAAFGYALRRALSPETRNRIAFEMRREVKRVRKARRRAARRRRPVTVTEENAA
jgi:hypothetical protein